MKIFPCFSKPNLKNSRTFKDFEDLEKRASLFPTFPTWEPCILHVYRHDMVDRSLQASLKTAKVLRQKARYLNAYEHLDLISKLVCKTCNPNTTLHQIDRNVLLLK